jgi:hypothetical protein
MRIYGLSKAGLERMLRTRRRRTRRPKLEETTLLRRLLIEPKKRVDRWQQPW